MLRAAAVCALNLALGSSLLALTTIAHADGKIDKIAPVTASNACVMSFGFGK